MAHVIVLCDRSGVFGRKSNAVWEKVELYLHTICTNYFNIIFLGVFQPVFTVVISILEKNCQNYFLAPTASVFVGHVTEASWEAKTKPAISNFFKFCKSSLHYGWKRQSTTCWAFNNWWCTQTMPRKNQKTKCLKWRRWVFLFRTFERLAPTVSVCDRAHVLVIVLVIVLFGIFALVVLWWNGKFSKIKIAQTVYSFGRIFTQTHQANCDRLQELGSETPYH